MIVVKKDYPTVIDLDGETVRIRVTRLTVEQASAFNRDLYQSAHPESSALVCRQESGPEQEKKLVTIGTQEIPVFVVSDEEIRDRRIAEMSVEDQSEYHDRVREEMDFALKFLKDTLTRYVAVEPGQIIEEGPPVVDVTTGAQMLRLYGGRQEILGQLLTAVRTQNTWDEDSKKKWRSLFDSAHSSDARRSAAPGETSGLTAGDAETPASVSREGVGVPV